MEQSLDTGGDPSAAPTDQPTGKFYSPGQVAFAAFLGTPIAGCLLLASNFKLLDELLNRRRTIFWGAVSTLLLIALSFVLPGDYSFHGITTGYCIALWQATKLLQGDRLSAFIVGGGSKHSNWRVLGIGIVCLAVVISLIAVPLYIVVNDDALYTDWISIRARLGDSESSYELGERHYTGTGVPHDYPAAAKFFGQAAAAGHTEAIFRLGAMYRTGTGIERDDVEAARLFLLAANRDHVDAQFNLAVMFLNGEGLVEDSSEAVEWLRRAAELGDAGAQYNLGVIYRGGELVPQDYGHAAKWFRLAAAQGNADAQFNLGSMYDRGEGLRKSLVEAARWYELAANQSYSDAQYNLGLMYSEGLGVDQNLVIAYKWLTLSSLSATGAASKRANGALEWLLPQMTSEQIESGESLVNRSQMQPGSI